MSLTDGSEHAQLVIDTSYDVRSDAGGKDPDSHSKRLRGFHRVLWSKPLPNGGTFELDDQLRHNSGLGSFWLASDAITNFYVGWTRPKTLVEIVAAVPPGELDGFEAAGCTVGAYIVFPYASITAEGRWPRTINQVRGTRSKIGDRFDLTLECIRRHYAGQGSPLQDVLQAYGQFFDLFESFAGYTEFFLLQDLVDGDKIRFFTEFNDFAGSALPSSIQEYRRYAKASVDFVRARNARIDAYPTTVR